MLRRFEIAVVKESSFFYKLFARRQGIAAAETARSRSGIALPDEVILVATETESLK
jgi:hypothetical protein